MFDLLKRSRIPWGFLYGDYRLCQAVHQWYPIYRYLLVNEQLAKSPLDYMSTTLPQQLLNCLAAKNGPHPPHPLSFFLIQRVKPLLSGIFPGIKLSVFPLHPVSNQLNGAHIMVFLSVDMLSPIDMIVLSVQMQRFFNSLSFYVNMNKNGHFYLWQVCFVLFFPSGLFNRYLDPLGWCITLERFSSWPMKWMPFLLL